MALPCRPSPGASPPGHRHTCRPAWNRSAQQQAESFPGPVTRCDPRILGHAGVTHVTFLGPGVNPGRGCPACSLCPRVLEQFSASGRASSTCWASE